MIAHFPLQVEYFRGKDMVTYNLALTFLEQEVEHEEDLQSLQEDLELMVGRGIGRS